MSVSWYVGRLLPGLSVGLSVSWSVCQLVCLSVGLSVGWSVCRLTSRKVCLWEGREEQDLLENLDLELFRVKKSRLDLD